jgi:hypothetical protein
LKIGVDLYCIVHYTLDMESRTQKIKDLIVDIAQASLVIIVPILVIAIIGAELGVK